jgi:hypothetical protein
MRRVGILKGYAEGDSLALASAAFHIAMTRLAAARWSLPDSTRVVELAEMTSKRSRDKS